jgi:hypothetical protein
MLAEISKITKIERNEQNAYLLNRILDKMPMVRPGSAFVPSLDNLHFVKMVKQAHDMIMTENENGVDSFAEKNAKMNIDPMKAIGPRKIKSSLKGERIKVAVNGVRYSFGPVWNESVKLGTGIAVSPKNRVKLNVQASIFEIADAENMTVVNLCEAIAKHLD